MSTHAYVLGIDENEFYMSNYNERYCETGTS